MEIITEFWYAYISFVSTINQCELYWINKIQSEKLIIDLCSTYNTTLCILFFCHSYHEVIDGAITFYSFNWHAGEDDISSIRKWTICFRNRKIGILTHYHNMSFGKLLETLHIFWNMPWELVRCPNKKCRIHSKNCGNMHNNNVMKLNQRRIFIMNSLENLSCICIKNHIILSLFFKDCLSSFFCIFLNW